MKILLVGSNRLMAIERHYVHYLKKLGADVLHFTSADMVADFHAANIFNKILFKTGIYKGYAPVNRALIKAAYKFSPHIILIFKGMEIYPSTLKILRKDFKLTNYNPDHPFVIVSKGSGNNNVTNSVGLYHLHFCYSQLLQKEIETKFKILTVHLPFGFELADDDYPSLQKEPEITKACFLGNPDETRKNTILQLAQSGIAVDVYGHGWNKTNISSHLNITVFDAVYGLEFWKKLRQYRVQLNVFRRHNKDSHNMRTFEIPAAGGIELAPFSDEQASFFKEDEEMFFYKDNDEMVDKVKQLLVMPAEQAMEVRNNARRRSVESGYRYADRAAIVYQACKEMMQW